jgi:hypothetical protein
MSQVSEYSFEKMARPLTDCRKEIGKGAACTAARTHFGNRAMIYKSPGDNFFILPRLQEVHLLGQPFNGHRLASPFGNTARIFTHQPDVSYRHE